MEENPSTAQEIIKALRDLIQEHSHSMRFLPHFGAARYSIARYYFTHQPTCSINSEIIPRRSCLGTANPHHPLFTDVWVDCGREQTQKVTRSPLPVWRPSSRIRLWSRCRPFLWEMIKKDQMRIHQKLRCSSLKRGILTGALCLVAVCASAQEDTLFSGLPLPLTFTQQFVLTNNLLFASTENQLRNVEIVYAYDPTRLLNVLHKNKDSGKPQQYFEIEEIREPQGLWQMESSYRARQRTVEDLRSDDTPSTRGDRNVYLAISEDDYNRVLSEMPDQADSAFMQNPAKKFFLFQTQRSLAAGDPTDTPS